MRRARGFDGFETHEAADAVLGMDNQRALIEPGDFRDVIRTTLLAAVTTHEAVAQDILFADDDGVIGLEPALDRENGRRRLPLLEFG